MKWRSLRQFFQNVKAHVILVAGELLYANKEEFAFSLYVFKLFRHHESSAPKLIHTRKTAHTTHPQPTFLMEFFIKWEFTFRWNDYTLVLFTFSPLQNFVLYWICQNIWRRGYWKEQFTHQKWKKTYILLVDFINIICRNSFASNFIFIVRRNLWLAENAPVL